MSGSHGLSRHPLYQTHRGMMDRCYNPDAESYGWYGARGITVCPEWHDVAAFIAWIEAEIGPRPDGCTLDRWPDNNGNYAPGNVRWADPEEQGRNRRDNLLLTLDGVTRCAAQWSEDLGLTEDAIRGRISRGWSAEKTLTTPSHSWPARQALGELGDAIRALWPAVEAAEAGTASVAGIRPAARRLLSAAYGVEHRNEEWAEDLRRARAELDRVTAELGPVTASVTQVADGDGERLCEGCGKPLPKRDYWTQAHRDVRYHDDACRQRAYRQRQARS